VTIWVDADACPQAIKEILFRAAQRHHMLLILVANQALHIPRSPFIKSVRVASGFDVADNKIVQEVCSGDIVITADIPLAAEVVDKGAVALNPRGQLYTQDNVRERLQMRDMMAQLRAIGINSGGPPTFNTSDRHAFAAQLDRLLAQKKSHRVPSNPK
jgi:uncharacterized protein